MKSLFTGLLVFVSFSFVQAQQPGTLDPSFGNKGSIVNQSVKNTVGETVKVDKNGRILIGSRGAYNGFAFAFKIDALLPDGSPDLSFGNKGSTYILFPNMTTPQNNAGITSLVLLPDGKILAGGTVNGTGSNDHIAFAKLLPSGALDSSFGINGMVTTSFGYEFEGAGSLVVQTDGKIVSAGSVGIINKSGIYIDYVSVARFLPDGTKDLGFGQEGITVSKAKGYANAIALQKDSKIATAGYSGNLNSLSNFHIERYNTDGTYDKSFGAEGIADAKINGADIGVINDIVIQEDGKMVVTGITQESSTEPVLTVARYNPDGNFDQSFGENGIVTTSFKQYGGEGKKLFLAGEKGDKIIVAGTNISYFGDYANFAALGYQTDGTLDSEFGDEGIQTTDFGGIDVTTSAALQPDGKIILSGYSQTLQFPSVTYRALSRYYGYPQQVPLLVRIKRWLQNHTLTWKGLPAEDKIAYYTVEQSPNSSKGFTPVAKVSGAANVKDYSITNSRLLQGANYYRIKAVSTNGVIRYSEIVSADNMANTASVYPNPAKNYVTVQGLPTDETANISIADGSGTVKARGVSNGAAQYRSAVNSLQPGTYYVHITTGSKTETLKFVKE